MRVLVAEDDRCSAIVVQKMLERLGHDVVHATDGEEAWSFLAEEPIPLVISDWLMPRVDGLELCRKIRASRREVYTYILLITCKNQPGDRLAGLQAGADNFLAKPWDAEELAVHLEIATRILAVHEDLAHKNRQLEVLATVDGLTGLKNRRVLFEAIDRLVAQSRRGVPPCSLIMLDVDHFKSFNDTRGHLAGDQALVAVARAIESAVREGQVVARYGGEEFAILLESCNRSSANRVAERIQESIGQVLDWGYPLTVSMGVSTADPASPFTIRSLLSEADEALYEAKARGRNRVCHHLQGKAPAY